SLPAAPRMRAISLLPLSPAHLRGGSAGSFRCSCPARELPAGWSSPFRASIREIRRWSFRCLLRRAALAHIFSHISHLVAFRLRSRRRLSLLRRSIRPSGREDAAFLPCWLRILGLPARVNPVMHVPALVAFVHGQCLTQSNRARNEKIHPAAL